MKYLLITDIPAPWREKVYEYVYEKLGEDFHVVYSAHNEKRRLWTFPLGNHPKTLLKCLNIIIKGRERFLNPGIIPLILKNRPKVVVCFSLVPTIFLAFFVSRLIGSKIVVFADTWLGRDKDATYLQKLARKFVYNLFADAFLGASKQTLKMYKYYNRNVRVNRLFLSPLCADNDYFEDYLTSKRIEKKYDLMFSGRIVDSKNPLFFVEVILKVKEKLGHCSALIIGEGDEQIKNEMLRIFDKNGIEYCFPGFIEHKNLPRYYSQGRILLLPTSADCWGVVINEAFVCGVPVVTTNMTAAAGELVLHGNNGYVLDLNSDLWAENIVSLLKDPEKLNRFSRCAKETVRNFTFKKAAEGIVAAIKYFERK